MTLEWLLVVAAIAGLAGTMAYIVERVVNDEVSVVEDPTVLVLDAEIAAAFIAEEAYETALQEAATNPGLDLNNAPFVARFRTLCAQLAGGGRFGAVVAGGTLNVDPGSTANPYRCELTFHNLDAP